MNLKLRIKQLVFFTFILVGSIAFAQQSVSGTVSDNEGPLPGVSVSLKGSSRGTTSAADGTYTISVGDGAAITFSFVGYKPQTVSVGSQSSINVVLASDASELNEIPNNFDDLLKHKETKPLLPNKRYRYLYFVNLFLVTRVAFWNTMMQTLF
mgnify:CR=1 FL=1